MNCTDYNDTEYMKKAAKDIISKLEQEGLSLSKNTLDKLMILLNAVFKDVKDVTKIRQMNQKLEHMMEVVEDSIDYINNKKHYSNQTIQLTPEQKETYVVNGILHDIGRIFEIYCLGTSGAQINFNHALLGSDFLKGHIGDSLTDNSGNKLPVEELDELLMKEPQEKFTVEDSGRQRIPRLRLMCYPDNLQKYKPEGEEEPIENILTYCTAHHGDKDIPEDCPFGTRKYLAAIRRTDRIANLMQGMNIDPSLITGGKTAEEIASTYQANGDIHVIDDITFSELTTGARGEDGTIYLGVDRQRKKDEQGNNLEYTPMRMFLSRVGWIYADDNDLSFYKFCKDTECIEKYIKTVKPYLTQEDLARMEKIEKHVKDYISQKIEELSLNQEVR